MPKDELNAWQATECHNEFGTSGSLVADVKSLVQEIIKGIIKMKKFPMDWFQLHIISKKKANSL